MTHVIAPHPLAQPYVLVDLNTGREWRFASLKALAATALQQSESFWVDAWTPSRIAHLRAWNARDLRIDLQQLLAYFHPRYVGSGRYRRRGSFGYTPPGYRRRSSAVPGTGNRWGGSAVRNARVQAARREAAAVLLEEGEVAVRPSRRDRALPNSWDGRHRELQRCWKRQHKGAKSWDRLAV